jgi:hypothetical protein
VVADRLALREAGDDVEWDAWRTDEGAWVVTVTFTTGDKHRQAQWSYDQHVRHVAPLDDEARWFTEPEPAPPAHAPGRRLAPVPDGGPDLPDPLHAPDGPGGRGPWPGEAAAGPDLLDTLRERRGRRSRPLSPEEDEDGEGADPVREAIDTLLSRGPARPPVPGAGRYEDRTDGREHSRADVTRAERWTQAREDARPDPDHPGYGVLDPYFEPSGDQAHRDRHDQDADVLVLPDADPLPPDGADPEPHPEEAVVPSGATGRPGRKPRRASVPSWDDIIFGARRE